MMARLTNRSDDELPEALRQLSLATERNLNHLPRHVPRTGSLVLEWCELLSAWSDDDDRLTCAFMSIAHRKTAVQLASWMREAGMEVGIDAVGNVVGRYLSNNPDAKTLITGSHYDTGRNGGKIEGRLGILLPIAVVRHLHSHGETLPFHLEIVGFSDAKGLRFNVPFLGSRAVAGRFDMELLDHADEDGLSLGTVLHDAGHSTRHIQGIARRRDKLLGFVEVTLDGGQELRSLGMPVGVVPSLTGSSRYLVELTGVARDAASIAINQRRDAVAAAAEIILLVERCCSDTPSLAGTVCGIETAAATASMIPGACRLTVDIRAAQDSTRDIAVAAITNGIDAICYRRNMEVRFECLEKVAATGCDLGLRRKLDAAVMQAGLDPVALSVGTVHDAREMAAVTGVAMLSVRSNGDNTEADAGVSVTPDDIETAWQILLAFVRNFQNE